MREPLVREIDDYDSVGYTLRKVKARLRHRLRAEPVPTRDSYGRVAANGVASPVAVPRFDVSHMDGFAVVSMDLKGATEARPAALKVVEEVNLGSRMSPAIRSGQAARVFTGSVIPPGADTVLPLEKTEQRGDEILTTTAPRRGSFVYARGTDIRRGEILLKQGQVINAQTIGTLLSVGVRSVRVWPRPRVSLLATGSELTDDPTPRQGKVFNSHSPYFLTLLRALGCVPIDTGIAMDDPAEVSASLRKAIRESDFVLTLGGTSVGRADVVGEAVSSLDPEIFVHGIKMDRGRVAGIAVIGGKPVLMMPGPIQGAMNAFVLLGTEVIAWLSGKSTLGLGVDCTLDGAWKARRRFMDFRKVLYVKMVTGTRSIARPLVGDTESISVLSNADGYVVVPERVTHIATGAKVRVQLLPGFSFT